MSLFLVSLPSAGQSLSEETPGVTERFEELAHIVFPERDVVLTRGGARLIVHRAKSAFYSVEDQLHVERDGDDVVGFTLVHGYCWERTGPLLSARDLSELITQQGLSVEAVSERVAGEFIVVHLAADGRLVVFNDHSNFESVFYASRDGALHVSNRAPMIRAVAPELGKNHEVYAHMAAFGHRMFHESQVEGVLSFASGEWLEAEPGRHEVRWSPSVYVSECDKEDESERARLQQAAVEECVNALRRVKEAAGHVQLGLTGGKDSRLILAMLISAGMEKEIDFYTRGADDIPDVMVARSIAKEFGLNHRTNAPGQGTLKLWGAEELLYRIAAHAYISDGMSQAMSLRSPTYVPVKVDIAGLQGEVVRAFYRADLNWKKIPPAGEWMTNHGRWDSIGVMKPEFMEAQGRRLVSELQRWVRGSVGYDDVPNIYWITQLMPHWIGASRSASCDVSARVSPLNSPSYAKYAFLLSHEERMAERAHYEIMNSLCPRLCELPFAVHPWREELRGYGVRAEVFQRAVPKPKDKPFMGSWQHLINHNPRYRDALINLFAEHKGAPIFDYVDHEQLLTIMGRRNLPWTAMRTFYAFLSGFFASNGLVAPLPTHPVYERKGRPDYVLEHAETGRQVVYGDQRVVPGGTADESAERFPMPDGLTKLSDVVPKDSEAAIEGQVTLQTMGKVQGYARSAKYPFAQLTLEILRDDKRLDVVEASQKSSALKKRGIGNGQHWFQWSPKEHGVKHPKKLRVRVFDTAHELPYDEELPPLP